MVSVASSSDSERSHWTGFDRNMRARVRGQLPLTHRHLDV